MSVFKRGIENPEFIKELNSNNYFQKMVKDEDLFIAIRNEYLNVYYYGQSICKIEFLKRTKQLKWTSHKKYLGIEEDGYAATGAYLDKIDELKQNARKYGGKEKEQVKKHILEDKEICILDVEVTFGKEQGFGKRSIDYVAVEKHEDGKIRLVFYEAKHFDNQEIRANETPKVFEQIDKYEKTLNDPIHKIEILNSYKKILINIDELALNNKRNLARLIGSNASVLSNSKCWAAKLYFSHNFSNSAISMRFSALMNCCSRSIIRCCHFSKTSSRASLMLISPPIAL